MNDFFLSISPILPGAYRLHKDHCPFLAERENLISIGSFDSVEIAFSTALLNFRTISRCPFCAPRSGGIASNDSGQENLVLAKQGNNFPDMIFFAGVN